MKKYLFQFVVTLFAITSFTVVACSDDDEPNGSDASSSFTVNSVPYSEHPTTGASCKCVNYTTNGPTCIQGELYPTGTNEFELYPHININIVVERIDPSTLNDGYTLVLEDGSDIEYLTDVMQGTRYSQYVSGKITFKGYSNGRATFDFDNVKYAEADNESNVITLNGTMTCKYMSI
ncbi:hypothetical protein [uncultured Bacteroides sp.]|uniref:hypothetical protein n=1 Tax=uncultured Bacteroides sp. TaxID=162156 RepID=UPI0026203598|nr:hypothetical protein [uncultured Bacteroides sp.]